MMMKPAPMLSCLLLLLAMFFPACAQADSGDIQAASRSVVRVAIFGEVDGERRMIGHGSGLVVAPDKIITNAHVVEESLYNDSITFRIVPSQGSDSYTATLVKWSPENDLALLQLEVGARLPAASLLTGDAPDGSDVFAIGYPANVDIAMQLDEAETMRPQSPVKTRGTVSSGRSAKAFDTILHTAPIAPGNSGGPMVDACGRVVGINSFGSTNENGGSEFYFAISVKELTAFLRAQKVAYNSVSGPCRSVAELTAAEAEREKAARAKIAEEQRSADAARDKAEAQARRDAELDIIAERENRMALSGLLLLFALGCGGISYALFQAGRGQHGKIAAIVGGALTFAALLIFAGRPSFADVADRMKNEKPAQQKAADDKTPTSTDANSSGAKSCVFVPDRSKVTVSSTADIRFDWKNTGCVNDRTQYALDGSNWTRGFVPGSDQQVSLVSYNPDNNSYRIERYLLGLDAMQKARSARQQFNVKGCSTSKDKAQRITRMNQSLRDILPEQPNELLIFSCQNEG
ncbi:S1C family serine protease [Sphingorhabdus arenilitoris]|uniref:S1C family serine protease n=1 Tax=Sphingorhabdus arenilitoris TaxID=1490041 RepID=A0ABV8RK43_9SPHN